MGLGSIVATVVEERSCSSSNNKMNLMCMGIGFEQRGGGCRVTCPRKRIFDLIDKIR
jgi:hypothetical protein